MTLFMRLETRDRRLETKTKNKTFIVFFLLFLVSSLQSLVCSLAAFAFEGETIVTHETNRYFYKDGQVMKLQNQYEMTYYLDLDKNTLTRTRIYDFLNDKITPDETVYHIEKQLLSHPTNADRYVLKPSVRAVGQTSADSIELIVIQDKTVETVGSSSEEMVISRSKRMR